jgi:hypothetical protein
MSSKIKQCPIVEYRPQTEAPTDTGWYYARFKWEGSIIAPTHVETIGKHLFVRAGECNKFDLKELDWFGPVTEVREASKSEENT